MDQTVLAANYTMPVFTS